MELKLPANLHDSITILPDIQNLVVVGANGAGKSSFGEKLIELQGEKADKISGIKALYIQPETQVNMQLSGLSRLQSLIKERISTPRLTEYEKLMLRLQAEEFNASVNFKENIKKNPGLLPPVTKLDIIQEIWEKMFPHNRMLRKAGFIELISSDRESKIYQPERMSDGEKLVFYLIGAALCSPPNALLVIESPEILLHESIKNTLWNEIEGLRPDCTFVYLTHDMNFVTTRQNSQCIWIRAYDADRGIWDYELLNNNTSFPEELYIDLLGSRKPILFIEGTDSNSIDNRLYPLIYPDYLVKPMGGCQKVIETTKAFRQLKDFHNLESIGIVDRDRRTTGEIEYLREQNIRVPDVAEVENLLLLDPVIETVATRLMKNASEVLEKTHRNVIALFEKDLENQVLLHVKHRVRKKLEKSVNRKINSIEELSEHVNGLKESIHVDDIYQGISEKFRNYCVTGDYNSILKVYNQKGVLPQSKLCQLLGISNKESYLNLILSLLKENKEDAKVIRDAIRNAIGTNN